MIKCILTILFGVSCIAELIALDYWVLMIKDYWLFVIYLFLTLVLGFILCQGIKEEVKLIALNR